MVVNEKYGIIKNRKFGPVFTSHHGVKHLFLFKTMVLTLRHYGS